MKRLRDIIESKKTRDELERMNIDDLDQMAFGHKDGDHVSLHPSKIKIVHHGDLINPQHKFRQHGMKWVKSVSFDEPVEVSVHDRGVYHLEDGHHRYFAAKKLNRPLNARLTIKGKPINRILKDQEGKD